MINKKLEPNINQLLPICLPAILILASMALATYWAFFVPIFQAPDEDFHSDYIFSLYSRGRLIAGQEKPIAAISHPFVSYLLGVTNGNMVGWHITEKMPPGYGSKKYFNDIDRGAPDKQACLSVDTNPMMMAVYPVGYYGIVALGLSFISLFNSSLSVLIFAGRLFSVFLLGCGLSLSYCIMRQLGLSWQRACLLLASICFFPLVSFVGSYIQPDNLSFVSVSTCLFLALRWRKQPKFKTLYFLALAMGVLFLSKYHFFVCTGTAVIAMILAKEILMRSSLKRIVHIMTVLLIPSIFAALLQLWISWGANLPQIDDKHWHWFAVTSGFNEALKDGKLIKHCIEALAFEYKNLYLIEGLSFDTFWGHFGWPDTPLVIISPLVNDALRMMIQSVTNICVFLTLANIIRITIKLFFLSRRKARQAFFLACSNPVLNSYFLFVLFMFIFSIFVYHTFHGQGRHWFPYILPIFLSATTFAPQILIRKSFKRISFYTITIFLILYSVIGNYFSLQCINERYYKPNQQAVIDITKLEERPEYASSGFYFDYIDPLPIFIKHLDSYSFPRGNKIWLTGWAIDFIQEAPASAVFIFIDNKFAGRAIYGLDDTLARKRFSNENYRFTGFAIVIPTADLSLGPHVLKIKVVSADGRFLYDSGYTIKFKLK